MNVKKRFFLPLLLALTLALLPLLSSCVISESPETAETSKAPTTPETQDNVDFTAKETVRVRILMQSGDEVILELYPQIAPITVQNFVDLATSGFYDGLTFHRIYSGFMIQGGDPKGDGTGNSGTQIKGEFSANGVKNDLSHTRGVISMARGGSNMDSASCQFFIVHQDSEFLDGQYAAFGKLVEGYDVLDKLAATEVTYNAYGEKSKPLDPPVINSIRVITD